MDTINGTPMLLKLHGSSKHVARAWSKIGLFGEIVLDLVKCLEQIKKNRYYHLIWVSEEHPAKKYFLFGKKVFYFARAKILDEYRKSACYFHNLMHFNSRLLYHIVTLYSDLVNAPGLKASWKTKIFFNPPTHGRFLDRYFKVLWEG